MDPEVAVESADTTENDTALAELTSGFDGSPTETPALEPADAPAPAAVDTPATPSPKYRQITEDEFATLMSRAAEIEAIKATQEKSLGTAFGKIGGIERKLQELQPSTAAPVFDLPDDEIAELRADFPALANMLTKLKTARPATIDPQQVGAVVDGRIQKYEMRLLERQHKDWKDVTDGEAYASWAKTKGDAYIRELASASDSYDSGFIGQSITEFKAATAKARTSQTSRRDRIEDAVTPRGSAAPAQTGSTPEEDVNAGFNQSRRF